MTDVLADVVRDLKDEHESLEAVLARIPERLWEKGTHAPGWAVRDQVAHLAEFDEKATLAIRDEAAFREDARTLRFTSETGGDPAYLERARQLSPSELVEWWRRASSELVRAAGTLEPGRRLPWYGPPMSGVSFITARLMECWSHGLDVCDVVDVERAATNRLRHVAFLGVRTRSFSYVTRGLEPNETPVRVELRAPGGETWLFGDPGAEERIVGPAVDFCQVVTQRRHVADTDLVVVGPAAEEWMRYAQAFAGPPGQGRKPGQFRRKPGQ